MQPDAVPLAEESGQRAFGNLFVNSTTVPY